MDPVGLIHTIKERCGVCYTCRREYPAKAVRIADGQAPVVFADIGVVIPQANLQRTARATGTAFAVTLSRWAQRE